ncbi:hypothetical protein FP2506_00830 [Fulvimarina pelagi HTCC2506]|uniref:DUF1850 domain-containing protein n=1 Tax=Fulvimarina pelagi HTCC2506 TaxID=314231 RepID=Q0G2D1_9HYPH|nr:DUF1850 domain-containing protein [Fulvimarina pelagi]EAU41267.1 hypothetical protein FP2506_00830 [Fulvimarina pelagi HTCC2506]
MARFDAFTVNIAAALTAAMFLFVLTPAVARDAAPFSLVIANEETELYRFPARPDDRFTLAWIHSVEHETWEETFRITNAGAIEIHSTRFKTFGAGVPSDGADTTRIENGWVIMDGIDRTVDPLAVLATPKEDYRLHWNDEDYDLTPDDTPHVLTFVIVPALP